MKTKFQKKVGHRAKANAELGEFKTLKAALDATIARKGMRTMTPRQEIDRQFRRSQYFGAEGKA